MAGPMARHLYGATLATAVIVETASHGEGMKAAAEAALSGRFDAVVAAGGDGTAHDAAEGLIGYSTPLGILPLGTGNVFARELNLPGSPEALAGTLLSSEAHPIPVGQVNGRPFLFVVGVGFDAEAVRPKARSDEAPILARDLPRHRDPSTAA
jgi:diacylglycerol kinase (ATP)